MDVATQITKLDAALQSKVRLNNIGQRLQRGVPGKLHVRRLISKPVVLQPGNWIIRVLSGQVRVCTETEIINGKLSSILMPIDLVIFEGMINSLAFTEPAMLVPCPKAVLITYQCNLDDSSVCTSSHRAAWLTSLFPKYDNWMVRRHVSCGSSFHYCYADIASGIQVESNSNGAASVILVINGRAWFEHKREIRGEMLPRGQLVSRGDVLYVPPNISYRFLTDREDLQLDCLHFFGSK